ncbi:MAG: alanine dehydrogenase [Tissierellia bacterium]|nr:alanine dehydrogenase [Tissierellia bacterium]
MKIGIVKECKEQEYRVAATASNVFGLTASGHEVYVEEDAGIHAGISNEDYEVAGAKILQRDEIWAKSDMIYKVKEPLEEEYKYFREDLTIFCYLHLAANGPLKDALLENKTTAIGYETVEKYGKLPLLRPMSEIGGCIAVQDGAHFLTKTEKGKGILLQGLPGVAPAHVVVVGGGVAGTGAVRTAVGIGARVTVVDIDVHRLAKLADIFGPRLETLYSNQYNLQRAIKTADLVVGAVLVPGGRTPKIVTRDMVHSMEEGGVIVDIAIDQGSCVETMDHATFHNDPVYIKDGILHYAVANIPGKVPRAATQALSNVTGKYAKLLADEGINEGILHHESLKKGVNTYQGHIVHPKVAEAFDEPYRPLEELM